MVLAATERISCRNSPSFIHKATVHYYLICAIMAKARAAREPKDLLIVGEADHIMAFSVEPELYEKRVLGFLENAFK